LKHFGRPTQVFHSGNLEKCPQKIGIDAFHASI
jgi:hypothetical protein